MTTDDSQPYDRARTSRSLRIFLWGARWVWRGLAVLVVVGLLNFTTKRFEATQSFGGTTCEVRLVRSYNDYGLFEVTHGYSVRFGGQNLKLGQSVSDFDDLGSLYELGINTQLTVVGDVKVSFGEKVITVRLPQRFGHPKNSPPTVTVEVPNSLCVSGRHTLGDT